MWLLILITSFLSLVSNKNLSPCDAIGKTEKDLSHVAVIFVDFEPIFPITMGNYSMRATLSDQFDGVMKSFYQCYGASGGLQVFSLSVEQNGNSTNTETCRFEKNDFEPFTWVAGKRIELIVALEVARVCQIAVIRHRVRRLLPRVPFQLKTVVSSLCHRCSLPTNKTIFNETPFEIFEVSAESMIYERLERRVDSLTGKVPSGEGNLVQKYTYFSSVPVVSAAIWPSIAAVFFVIIFFFVGLLVCCCSLLFYALIEEDFRRRNEEREWIAANLRRQEFDNVIIPARDLPILNQEEIVPVVRTESTQLSEKMTSSEATARPRTSSSSSEDVETDKTQFSETISGSPRTRSTQIGADVELN